MKDNKKVIETKVCKLGFKLGTYDKTIDKVSNKEIKKIADLITGDSTDVDIKIRGKEYIVEICNVDLELDFNIITKEEYISRYGNERWEE